MLDRDLYGAQDVIRKRSNNIGYKLKIIFWITIIELGLGVLEIVATYVMLRTVWNFNDQSIFEAATTVAAGSILVMFILGIVYAIIMFELAHYNDAFKWSAILYLVMIIANGLNRFYSGRGLIGVIIQIASVCFTLMQMKLLCEGMIESLRFVDGVMTEKWESFKEIYVLISFAYLGAILLALIPSIQTIASMVAIFSYVALIIFNIWEIVLIWKSAVRLQNY